MHPVERLNAISHELNPKLRFNKPNNVNFCKRAALQKVRLIWSSHSLDRGQWQNTTDNFDVFRWKNIHHFLQSKWQMVWLSCQAVALRIYSVLWIFWFTQVLQTVHWLGLCRINMNWPCSTIIRLMVLRLFFIILVEVILICMILQPEVKCFTSIWIAFIRVEWWLFNSNCIQ